MTTSFKLLAALVFGGFVVAGFDDEAIFSSGSVNGESSCVLFAFFTVVTCGVGSF